MRRGSENRETCSQYRHQVANWEDVERIALALPGVEETTTHDANRSWKVRGRPVVWQRPLRQRDVDELGEGTPTGPVAGVRTADLDARERFLVEMAPAVFVTSHFDGYPAVLLDLDRIDVEDLRELITESWVRQAPRSAVKAFRSEPDA
jgi:hypothetical protein